MRRLFLPLVAFGLLIAGCNDNTAPRPRPLAPQGLYSVTGDHGVVLHWLPVEQPTIVGYRVYQSPCANGPDCPYKPIASTDQTDIAVTGLANGVTAFFAVSSVDKWGQESDLSYTDVFDTPRPAGTGLLLGNYLTHVTNIGYDFSTFSRLDQVDPPADVFFGYYRDNSGVPHRQMFVPDLQTDIQDAGYASSLDAVDFAPTTGWSPYGTAEAVLGHCYVVWTRENNYAKFRITDVDSTHVTFDWAFQTDPGNRELKAKPAAEEGSAARRPVVWLASR